MARFHIRDAFAVNDRGTFVLSGFIAEGEIDRIEYIRRPDGDVVCLCIRCSVPEEVTLWEELRLKDKSVEVTTTK